jgi:tetratricopeptide (TPR) repeat protein
MPKQRIFSVVNIKDKGMVIPMKIFVNTVRPLFSYGVNIVLIMVLLLSFTLSGYGQGELWKELNDKANKLYQQGRYSEAVSVAKEALKIAEEIFGKDHPDVATVLKNMAGFYTEIGKEDEVEKLAERAKIIRSKYQ